MSIESPQDLAALQRVGRVVGTVLAQLRGQVRPGVTTAELDRTCAELLARYRARSAPSVFYGFPGAICISVNDEAVHGVPGSRVIAAGDVVKLDLVVQQDGYVADAAGIAAGAPRSADDMAGTSRAPGALVTARGLHLTGGRGPLGRHVGG